MVAVEETNDVDTILPDLLITGPIPESHATRRITLVLSVFIRNLLVRMRPSFACFSKASRRPLTPKRGNKDYYKGS